jgi:hypothetical protein
MKSLGNLFIHAAGVDERVRYDLSSTRPSSDATPSRAFRSPDRVTFSSDSAVSVSWDRFWSASTPFSMWLLQDTD